MWDRTSIGLKEIKDSNI